MRITVPALLYWSQQDTKATTKQVKSAAAFNLAEAAVNRAVWELKGTPSEVTSIQDGTALSGYHFDKSYSDLATGTYAVWVGSVTSTEILIIGVGRDSAQKEVRAIKAY